MTATGSRDPRELLAEVNTTVDDLPGLGLLVLHGSRARGGFELESDWDFGYLANDSFSTVDLHVRLTTALSTDRVDLVNLATATALLRFRAARDGVAVLTRPADAFTEFRIAAIQFWCDAGPVIRAAHEDVLSTLR